MDFQSILAALTAIGKQSSDPVVLPIPTDGLDDKGLPAVVPVLWNRNTQTPVDLSPVFNKFRLHPIRRRGTAEAATIESLIALVNRQKTEESAIFADILDWQHPSLTAVINYNPRRQTIDGADVDSPIEADWGDHRIKYFFPISDEWEKWMAGNGKVMSQGEFAAFIEDNIPHLAAPTEDEASWIADALMVKVASPSVILSLSRGLQVNINATTKNNVVLSSGEGELTLREEHVGENGQKLIVPGAFIVSIPLFHMGEAVRVPVRLRYRARSGEAVKWFYQLYRPEVVVGERLRADATFVGEETGLPVYDGKPEVQADRSAD